MKKTLKKCIATALTATMLLTFAGCGSSGSTESESSAPAEANSDVATVAIIQAMDNPAFDDMRDGMMAEFEAKGYGEDKLNVRFENAQGDSTNLNTIVQNLIDEEVTVLAPIGTPAAQACVATGTEIPTFFTSVSDPIAAGIISDFENPDMNATGTSNKIPVEEIIDLAQTLTPDVKTFGFIYNTSEDNAVSTVEAAKAIMDERGLAYEEVVITNSSEVQQAAQTLFPKVDAVFIPNSAMVQSAMPLVAQITREYKIPTYSCSAATVAAGSMATLAMSDAEIGALTADMIIEYLEGKAITEIPTIVVPASHIVLNEDLINDIGITFPEGTTDDAEFIKETTAE